MKSLSEVAKLEAEIEKLQSLQDIQLQEVQDQFHLTVEGFKPSNIISNMFKKVVTPSKDSSSIIDNTLGIASGFLTRKFLFGASANPAKKAIGTMIQFGISNLVYKNSFAIKAIGGFLFNKIFNREKQVEMEDKAITIT